MRLKIKENIPHGRRGFTLVELMVVVSIVAILSAVAVPAYINYVNRSKQSDAAGNLMTARLEMEEFFSDNGRYASTIQCLPSFVASANTACLGVCGAGCPNSFTGKYYTFRVVQVAATYYRVAATRQIYTWAQTDNVTISSRTDSPTVANVDALKFSLFQLLFQ